MTEQPDIPEQQLDLIFHYGAYPLWAFLDETLGINIVDVCARVAKEAPVLKTEFGSLSAITINLPYNEKLAPTFNNDQVFLLNAINIVFESLKAGVERDGEKILQHYRFKLDEFNNMYLIDTDTNQPVCDKGITVIKLNE